MGIIKDDSSPKEILTKAGKTMLKRTFQIFDDSGCEVDVTIWGEQCGIEGLTKNTIILINNALINEFNSQKGLNYSFTTKITINPNIPQAIELE